jgi:hypothetical protein
MAAAVYAVGCSIPARWIASRAEITKEICHLPNPNLSTDQITNWSRVEKRLLNMLV